MPRSRLFTWTINNYTDKDIELLKSIKVNPDYDCLVCAYETGETNGTPHLQCAAYFKNARTLASMNKKAPRGSFRAPKKGDSPPRAVGYCCKGECPKSAKPKGGWETFTFDNPHETAKFCIKIGKFPVGQGSKNKFGELVEDNGFSLRSLLQHPDTTPQCLQYANKYLELLEPPRTWKTEVIVHFGPTGRGKDHTAKLACGATFENDTYHYENIESRPYTKSIGDKWWFGYDGHADVILSDFRDHWYTFSNLLNILEGEYVVECKGGSRQFVPKRIFITCQEHPSLWYQGKTAEDRNQLLGRISKIIDFNGKPLMRKGCIDDAVVSMS